MNVLLSIIIPIYNVEKYIKECFDSIKNQDVGNEIEIICIDDGSDDKSGIICDEYAKYDKRFKVIHQKNQGVSVARNEGIKIAKGKYIGWIDPDDYISNDWWENIKSLLEHNSIDLLFFDYIIMDKGKFKQKRFSNESRYLDKEKFLNEITIDRRIQNQLWQKIFKRELIEGIFFPKDVSLMEDYAVLHKIVLKSEKIYYLSKPLYFYRVRDDSIGALIPIDKNYKSFLIAKERYNFLLNNNINIPKIGYLMRAMSVCIQYYKMNKEEKIKNKDIYMICKKELDLNKKYIFNYNDCDIKIKVKFLLYTFNLLHVFMYFKNLL